MEFICPTCERPLFEGVAAQIIEELYPDKQMNGSQLAEKIGVTNTAISKAVRKEPLSGYIVMTPLKMANNVKVYAIGPSMKKFLESCRRNIK